MSLLLRSLPTLAEFEAGPTYDGTASGGVVFGGSVVEVVIKDQTDGAASGGVVLGSAGDLSAPENNQVDASASSGIVFGGTVLERWVAEPNNLVAVQGGTYRISGVLYSLASSLSYPGLGAIGALVNCGTPPATAGRFRYDLLSIDTTGAVTLTAGSEATVPVMPTTPTGELRLNHVLRYYGQSSIKQTDIGKMWTAPEFAALEVSVSDDELAWAELTSTLTATCRDQYGQGYTGQKSINASFIVGNGTISPLVRSGASATMAFTYTRNQDANDSSPIVELRSPSGPFVAAYITLLDISGNIMT